MSGKVLKARAEIAAEQPLLGAKSAHTDPAIVLQNVVHCCNG
jgi:hypothetical protein